MTRDKIKAHIIAGVTGRAGMATVTRIALDQLFPAVIGSDRHQFLGQLAFECGCTYTEWEDDGFMFRPDPNGGLQRLDEARVSMSRAVFDADSLRQRLEKALPETLRMMADAIERGELFAETVGFAPWGMNKNPNDTRMHILVKLHLASEMRK